MGTGTQVSILRELSLHADTELTETQLSELCEKSRQAVHMNLEPLEKEGIVKRRRVGNLNLIELNGENVLSRKIRELFDLEAGLKGVLLSELEELFTGDGNVKLAYLFGSVARGEDSAESDIDLFLCVREKKRFKERAYPEIERIEKRFSKMVSLNLNDMDELEELMSGDSPLLASIVEEGRWICGEFRLYLDAGGGVSKREAA